MVVKVAPPESDAPWVVPADLHDGGGVIRCSPERDRLLNWLCDEVESGTWVDGSNEPAAETAARIRAMGARRTTVLATPRDGRAVTILAKACRETGLEVEFVQTRLDGFMPGAVSSSEHEYNDFELPLEHEALAGWLAPSSCRPEVRSLVPIPLTSFPVASRVRSPLPPGILVDEIRDLLVHFASEAFPVAVSRLHSVLGWHALGMNPREVQYAGLGLIEHNAELLVNIVPGERGSA